MTVTTNKSELDIPAGFRLVELSREPVELYKILKFEGLAENGGAAKAAIADGLVLVNGVVETQKRKKILSGDRIEFGADKIFVKLTPTCVESERVANAEVKLASKAEIGIQAKVSARADLKKKTKAKVNAKAYTARKRAAAPKNSSPALGSDSKKPAEKK